MRDAADDHGLMAEQLLAQVRNLADDIRGPIMLARARVQSLARALATYAPGNVFLVGSGDSYHACRASAHAFAAIARQPTVALSTFEFSPYTLSAEAQFARAVVIAVSASGRTPRLVAAVREATARGALTVGITTRYDSPLAEEAVAAIVVDLPHLPVGPGVRTFQANLSCLLLLAAELGSERAGLGPGSADATWARILAAAAEIESTTEACLAPSAELSGALLDAGVVMVLGGGPAHGVAMYAAAKLVEAARVRAIGQELEEWWHVERRMVPGESPVIIVAPPGASSERARETAAYARSTGRTVAVVSDGSDRTLLDAASVVMPVTGILSEPFAPLLYHVFAGVLAASVASQLGNQQDR